MNPISALPQEFLDAMTDKLFGSPPDNFPDNTPDNTPDKLCFQLRFDPENFQSKVTHKRVSNTKIAQKIKEEMNSGYTESTIQRTLNQVIQTVVNTYGEEMRKDGVSVDELTATERGKHGKWEKVYQWLWHQKFDRWQVDWVWESLHKKANFLDSWLRFVERDRAAMDRAMVFHVPPRPASEIPLNKRLDMMVELPECQQHHLLLLNRELARRTIICPSWGLAPKSMISDGTIWLPQENSAAEKGGISFDEVGEAEYLAIVLREPLELEWLQVREGEACIDCDWKRMNQLWEQLSQQSDWRVFYRKFQVVASNSNS